MDCYVIIGVTYGDAQDVAHVFLNRMNREGKWLNGKGSKLQALRLVTCMLKLEGITINRHSPNLTLVASTNLWLIRLCRCQLKICVVKYENVANDALSIPLINYFSKILLNQNITYKIMSL